MQDFSFFNEMSEEFAAIEKIDSETLKYRFDKFVCACDMELNDSKPVKCTGDNGLPYINKSKKNDEKEYNINFALNYDHKRGKSIVLMGKYNDLNLMFVNYCDTDTNKDRINEIPFFIKLGKVYNGSSYVLEIQSEYKSRVRFILRKDNEKMMIPRAIVFHSNVLYFGKIQKLVKSFVNNPEYPYKKYNDVCEKKDTVFSNADLNAGLLEDNTLDEPVKGVKKLIRSLFNY